MWLCEPAAAGEKQRGWWLGKQNSPGSKELVDLSNAAAGVTVGIAWTSLSKRLDKGDRPCARRGRDSCLSYDDEDDDASTRSGHCAHAQETTPAVFEREWCRQENARVHSELDWKM